MRQLKRRPTSCFGKLTNNWCGMLTHPTIRSYRYPMIPDFLYKYRAVNKLTLMSLINRSIWLSSPEHLNDPFDCNFKLNHEPISKSDFIKLLNTALQKNEANSKPNIHNCIIPEAFDGEKISDFLCEDILGFKNHIEKSMKKTGILSLTINHNNMRMWSLYADGHKGICIGYKPENLFKNNNIVEIAHKVNYLISNSLLYNSFELYARCLANEDKNEYKKIIYELLSTKTSEWSYEQEWRIISQNQFGNFHYDESALISIFFGLKCPSDDKVTIRNILSAVPMYFYQMVKSESSPELIPVLMEKDSKYWHESPE